MVAKICACTKLPWQSARPDETTHITPASDDEQLIRLAFARDSVEGCEMLFRRYLAPFWNQAVRFVYSREIARDLVSAIFRTFRDKPFGSTAP